MGNEPLAAGFGQRTACEMERLLLCTGLVSQPSQCSAEGVMRKLHLSPLPKSIGRPRGSPNWILLTEKPLQQETQAQCSSLPARS